MAERFRTNGAAAYDIYTTRGNTARPLPRPKKLPEEPKPQPQKKPAAHFELSAFTILGGAMALFLLFLVVFSYARLYEATSEGAALQESKTELTEENERLSYEYESKVDLETVAERARELGMREPLPTQIRVIEIPGSDTTEVFAPEEKNTFVRIFEAFQSVFVDLTEYFS